MSQKSDKAEQVYRCKQDGKQFFDRNDIIEHEFEKHIESFYVARVPADSKIAEKTETPQAEAPAQKAKHSYRRRKSSEQANGQAPEAPKAMTGAEIPAPMIAESLR